MAWQIGIDEAGYGPNLGPFVMTLAAAELPESEAEADLWQLLQAAVRRAGDPTDDRLLVADSKLVHIGGRGLERLEANTLPFILLQQSDWSLPLSLEKVWRKLVLTPWSERTACPWAKSDLWLPLGKHPCEEAGRSLVKGLDRAMRRAGVACLTFRCVVVMPRQFNLLVQSCGTKAAVSEWAASRLLRFLSGWLPQSAGMVLLYADKHGGRHHYRAFLQQVFSDRFVMTVAERPEAARYRLVKSHSVWEAVFQPRAESASFVVALASMLSKYLREVLMDEFNDFWQAQVPNLRPTAGYPLDARRFLADIESARQRLRIPQQILWRER